MRAASLGLQDSAVPGVAVVADGDTLGGLLASVGQELLDRSYLRYKPGTSLVATLRLPDGPAFAYAVSDAARPKLAKLVDRAPQGAVLLHRPEDGVLVARPAADRDLPGVADPRRLTRLVGPVTRWTTLAYKPQRRWVARPAEDPVPRAVVRAYRPEDLPGALAGWQLAARLAEAVTDPGVTDRSGFTVPALLASLPRYGLAAVEWSPGEPLDRLLQAEQVPTEVLAGVGGALARLHGSLGSRAAHRSTPLDHVVVPVLRELAAVRPDLARRGRALHRELAASAPRPLREHPIHGDFSTDQVILDEGRIGFADWDRAGWGDPAADLGSLRAAGLPAGAYPALLAGYDRVREVPSTVDWYARVEGMRRLTEPLRRCDGAWRTAIEARLTALECGGAAPVSGPMSGPMAGPVSGPMAGPVSGSVGVRVTVR